VNKILYFLCLTFIIAIVLNAKSIVVNSAGEVLGINEKQLAVRNSNKSIRVISDQVTKNGKIIQRNPYSFDTGLAPEADGVRYAQISPDNSVVAFCNEYSDNVSIHRVSDGELVTTLQFDHGAKPQQLAFSDEYLVISLNKINKIAVYRTSDWSEVEAFDSALQPLAVRVANEKAFVTCAGADVLEVIDLRNMTKKSIAGVPYSLASQTVSIYYGRSQTSDCNFLVNQNGTKAVSYFRSPYGDQDYIAIVNIDSGLVKKIAGEKINQIVGLGMSGNGEKIVFTSQSYNDDTKYFFRIDLTTEEIDKELTINTSNFGFNFNCVANIDGSKMLYEKWLVDFEAGNYQQLSSSGYINDYISSNDGTKIFELTWNSLKAISFESGEVLNEFNLSEHIMSKIIATTDDKKIITYDGLFNEYALVLNFENNTASLDKTFSIGCDPEGDGSRQIQITPDGKKAVISNTISCSITIVDLVEKQVEYVIPLETELAFGISAHCGAITADSRYFIATTDKAENIKIIDLNSGEIVKSVKTGISGICQIAITPDGKYAFAGSGLVGMTAKIRLADSATVLVQTFPTTTVTSAYNGEFSSIKITPDGTTLIKTGVDNTLNLYSTEDGTLLKSIDLGGGYYGLTHSIAYNSDCTLALVTVSNYIVLVKIDGVNSEIINSQQVVDGNYEYAWGASYNKKYNHFSFFTSDGKFMQLNPEDNSIGINVQIPDNGNLTLNGIDIDKNGKELYYYTKLEDVGNWS